MRRCNEGIIYTTNNCIGCNKCISHCSIFGANISLIENGRKIIKVNSDKCIHCGKCINQCLHSARKYKDDTDAFFEALLNGENISVTVDPSFYILYGERAKNIIGYLKKIGVKNIYDESYGAEISVWAHLNYINQHRNDPEGERAFFSQICPFILNSFERYFPNIEKRIIPVHSPFMCTAIYAHEYLNDKNKIASLGPCISRKDEICSAENKGNVDYCLTYKSFMQHINNVDLEKYSGESDLKSNSLGDLLSFTGGMKEALSYFLPPSEYMLSFSGITPRRIEEVYNNFLRTTNRNYPAFVELLGCDYGCYKGPGIENSVLEEAAVYANYNKIRREGIRQFAEQSWQENAEYINSKFSALKVEDFSRVFENRFLQQYSVPKIVTDEIFSVMLKNDFEKQNINCGACGYSTCKEMAEAIALGYNKKENCVHYMNDEMIHQYYTSPLTELPNMQGFSIKVRELLSANLEKNYTVCVGNINKSKIINGLYGPQLGDEVFKIVKRGLIKELGEDVLIGQFGGFFALCFENTPDNLSRLRGIKNFDARHYGIEIPITLRFGIINIDDREVPIEVYINNATIAMDLERQPTRNTYCFYNDDLKDRIIKEVVITNQMQSAIDADEFAMYFQPQYSVNGVLVGAESLCRWVKGKDNVISPSSFIPVSEKNGFIRLLDKIIWEKAFSIIRSWMDEEIDIVPISINISRISLENDTLIYTIDRLRKQYNVPSELIHFEITENVFAKDMNALIERVQRIRNFGFKIALDDFGTGYSSLNALKDMPIDILKLDMGFLRRSSNMDKGGQIITSVVKMARDLQLLTIAEGVETQEQLNFLKTVGCDIIQGFIFSKPISEDEFKELMLDSKRNTLFIENGNTVSLMDIRRLYDPNSGETIMFENLTGPAAVLEYENGELNLIRCNEKSLKIFGVENKSFSTITMLFKNHMSNYTVNIFLDTVKKAINTGEECVCITSHETIDLQKPVWIKSHIWYIGTIGDRHTIYVNVEDITQSKLNENTLLLANKQFSMILENSMVGMMLTTMSVDFKNYADTLKVRVLKVNAQYLKLTGYSEEEVLTWTEKELSKIIHPLDRPVFTFKSVKSLLQKEIKPFDYVYRIKNKEGKYIRIHVMMTAVKEDDGSFTVVSNYVDYEKEKGKKK